VIKLHDVTRVYQLGGEPFRALDGVTFDVQPGEFVAINGPSGSGKSTLANIIGGLDRATSGTVIVNGQELSGLKDAGLSSYRNGNVGFVFQSFNLQANATALENVTLPMLFAGMRPRARKTRALECLEAVGLADRAAQRANQLSGGQRQRVAIARALALEPSILIADEPTGNLDSARGEEIIELLKERNAAGTTLLVITHDAGIATQAQRVVEVRDGRITERGSGHAVR
jgi:putative ABC transport system ATP-binding protein